MNLPYHPQRLFTASCVALIATAMTFAIRANLIGKLGTEFALSASEMGIVFGTAFWGFTLAMIVGGPLCDYLGMSKLLAFAFFGHVVGVVLTMLATGFWSLFISTLLIGIANGFVEAACNPLVSSLYPTEKTKKLNQLHVWFPGGIVIGGLAAYLLERIELGWQTQMACILLPTLAYGLLFFKQSFPQTERVSSGVSAKEMFAECKRPLFILMVGCMLLTAATELGTNQWIAELLGNVGVPSILLLVFINGLMALGRSFAGRIEERLSVTGMLLFSAIFSMLGLLLLSQASSYWTFGAAFVFAIGICYFWPTMLAFVSEYLPKTGALGLSVMGGAGMLSVALILPSIGQLYEAQIASFLPHDTAIETLKNAAQGTQEAVIWAKAKLAGGAATLRYVAILPGLLIFAFGSLFLFRSKLKKTV